MTTAVQERLNLTLADAKAYLRVEVAEDDALIESLIEGVKVDADMFLNNPFEDDEGDPLSIPNSVRTWCLRRIAQHYEQRLEGVVNDTINTVGNVIYSERGVDFSLLRPYRLNPGL